MTPPALISDYDIHLFSEGSHFRLYEKLGARPFTSDGQRGVAFAVWAPNAEHVGVAGDFNGWNTESHPLRPTAGGGIWHGFIPGLDVGAVYKYHVRSRHRGYRSDRTDPFAFTREVAPATGSIVASLDYEWHDQKWMERRKQANAHSAPISIYEAHIGSWRHVPEQGDRSLTYRELADRLTDYLLETGFTHVELLPVMEHPFYGSWGYQSLGYFAPTSRFGAPQDFMLLVDRLHQAGIGVILDWVPAHFPTDEHGLGYFDGTHLYEHEDARMGVHPDWNTFIFNYGRPEVRSFLISSGLFWADKYHVDGFRVDAVASMLYLDYSRKPGEWIPNRHGGNENLEAVEFLRRFNDTVHGNYPDVITIAEESTAWPQVTRPTQAGGLGFDMKWDMGWMHDTLLYFSRDPIRRSHHHGELAFRMTYAFRESYVLPLSHDEVVHGQGSLLQRMPGDDWQKLAGLRLLLGYMYSQPGKKLLFMGGEFGQREEWSHDRSLDWHLLRDAAHAGLKRWLTDLNRVYRSRPALHGLDFDVAGFQWLDAQDAERSTLSYLRSGPASADRVVVVCNMTPVPRYDFSVGVPAVGFWTELLNSDAAAYGGSNVGSMGGAEATPQPRQGQPCTMTITLPPLAIVFFERAAAV